MEAVMGSSVPIRTGHSLRSGCFSGAYAGFKCGELYWRGERGSWFQRPLKSSKEFNKSAHVQILMYSAHPFQNLINTLMEEAQSQLSGLSSREAFLGYTQCKVSKASSKTLLELGATKHFQLGVREYHHQ